MPIYMHPANLIVEIKTIESLYHGGKSAFYEDHKHWKEIDEDNEVIRIAAMNTDDFDIDLLMERGLEFDPEKPYSPHFCVYGRYGHLSWVTPWLVVGDVFCWHVQCDEDLIDRAKNIMHTSIDELAEAFDRGENLLRVLKH